MEQRKPIGELTRMRVGPWRDILERSGYAARFSQQTDEILRGIEFGVRVDFEGDREAARFGRNLPVTDEDAPKISAIIAADVASGKKAGPFARPPLSNFCVSPIGCVPKKGGAGKIRMIHHLSFPFGGDSINASVRDAETPIGRFAQAVACVQQAGRRCWLVKLDVEAAYKQIPVHPEDWHLLGFVWQGAHYYERVLPFGLKSSCRLWELFAVALHWLVENWLQAPGVVHYVDDFLLVVADEGAAAQHLREVLALCATLGIPMAADKTEGPVTCLTFLGIELDTAAMQARLPRVKLDELRRLAGEWEKKTVATKKELQSLAGIINFACSVIPPGRAFLRRIINHTARMEREQPKGTRQAAWDVPPAVKADVRWWGQFAERWNGVSLLLDAEWTDADKLELFTDACESGYGALCGDQWLEARWTDEQRALARRGSRESMPWFELFALTTAVVTWGHRWQGRKIRFRCDCMPVVQAVQKLTTRTPSMMHLVRQIVASACDFGFDFRIEHIPGVSNIEADLLSRYGCSSVPGQDFRAARPNARQRFAASPTAPRPFLLPTEWESEPEREQPDQDAPPMR
jgi:hypothetical protein